MVLTRNSEIEAYWNLLCDEEIPFLSRYIETPELQRLAGVGQFCGCDYTKIHDCKYYFSRLDHSIACARMAWHFTKDKKQTLAALFHDLGTPAFSHCVDYLLGDNINQESSEKAVADVLTASLQIKEYLKEEQLEIEDVTNIEKYSIVENKKPKICIDRLDGVLGTGLIWQQFWTLKDIKKIYEGLTILENEIGKKEIGFVDQKLAEHFFEGVFQYSIVLQQNEDKFTMQFIADCLKVLLRNGSLKFDELYQKSEQEIIHLFEMEAELQESWTVFTETDKVYGSDVPPVDTYYVSIDSKKRFVIPLLQIDKKVMRLDQISTICRDKLEAYQLYQDEPYAYIGSHYCKKKTR